MGGWRARLCRTRLHAAPPFHAFAAQSVTCVEAAVPSRSLSSRSARGDTRLYNFGLRVRTRAPTTSPTEDDRAFIGANFSLALRMFFEFRFGRFAKFSFYFSLITLLAIGTGNC